MPGLAAARHATTPPTPAARRTRLVPHLLQQLQANALGVLLEGGEGGVGAEGSGALRLRFGGLLLLLQPLLCALQDAAADRSGGEAVMGGEMLLNQASSGGERHVALRFMPSFWAPAVGGCGGHWILHARAHLLLSHTATSTR